MNHWIIAPVVLPAMMAPFLVLVGRFDIVIARTLSLTSAGCLLLLAIGLFVTALDGIPRPYLLGAWPAPFGIVLVLDRLSALMLLLTGILGLAVACYAALGWDQAGRHFHALFQFQLMGVNGAFLTGDLFNLFVFFEVLLIASYGLALHGGGADRFRTSVHYIVINLTGSTLFLFAVGLIYAVTGTLNMADLALKVPLVGAGDAALLRAGALLLLVVFGVKAALVPLHFWLPATYSAAAPPVAALFAIMTKVGAYSILRVYTLVFGADAGVAAWIAAPWILPAALATMILAAIGTLGARDLTHLVAWTLIGSMGTLLVGIGLFTPGALAAGLFYLVHSTLSAALLFLLADIIARRRGGLADALLPAPPMAQEGLVAGLFLGAAIAMAGMPPLSGFLGKLLVLQAAAPDAGWVWVWAIVLGTSLVTILAFARAGSTLFWKSAALAGEPRRGSGQPPVVPFLAPVALLGLLALLTIGGGRAMRLFDSMADELMAPSAYIEAVLGPRTPPIVGR